MRICSLFLLLSFGVAHGADKVAPVRFSRDILPILSENCFQCHGPDEKARKAHLRLDIPDCLKAEAKSGLAVIAPKRSAESELVGRINSADASQLMPPPKS